MNAIICPLKERAKKVQMLGMREGEVSVSGHTEDDNSLL